MRVPFDSAKAIKRDLVVIMIDLKAAFHKVINQLVYNMQPYEDHIRDVIDNIDIPEAMIPAIVNKHVTDQHIVEVLTEAYKGTWFFIHREASCAAPRLGTRPGVPTADFTLNALMADVTADYHQRATTDGVVVTMPEAPQHFQQSDSTKTISSTSFVDDVKAAATTNNGNDIHQLVCDSQQGAADQRG
eukprot:9100175-Pyramimonas_sp.AAC.1